MKEVELKTLLWQEEDGSWRARFEATKPEAGKALTALLRGIPSYTPKDGEGDVRSLVLIPAYPGSPGYPQHPLRFEIFVGYD